MKTPPRFLALLGASVVLLLAQPDVYPAICDVSIRVVDSFGDPIQGAIINIYEILGLEAPRASVEAKPGESIRLKQGSYDVVAKTQTRLPERRRYLARIPHEIWIIGLQEPPTDISIRPRRLLVRRSKKLPARVDEARLCARYITWEEIAPFDSGGEVMFQSIPDGAYELVFQNVKYEISRYLIEIRFGTPPIITWDMNIHASPPGLKVISSMYYSPSFE